MEIPDSMYWIISGKIKEDRNYESKKYSNSLCNIGSSTICNKCSNIKDIVAYGLSIHFYIMAQKDLGAAKTSAYYSVAPFIGTFF